MWVLIECRTIEEKECASCIYLVHCVFVFSIFTLAQCLRLFVVSYYLQPPNGAILFAVVVLTQSVGF